MVVQHNLTAMNSNRMLGITTGAQAKSTEKLSSGYKINRAADDAAGLSISEKMRKQIRGLTQASANAQDGISAVQTAEGALTEVHDMLQRMNELAVKAANGTNSESDRSYIQDEIDQLVTEIDRVSETTKFNETYLLKGDKNGKEVTTYSYVEDAASMLAEGKTLYEKNADGSYTQLEAGTVLDPTKTYYSAVEEVTTEGVVGEKLDLSKGEIVGKKIDLAADAATNGNAGDNVVLRSDIIQGFSVDGKLVDAYTYDDTNHVYVKVTGMSQADTNKTNAGDFYYLDEANGTFVKWTATAGKDGEGPQLVANGTAYVVKEDKEVFDAGGKKYAAGAVLDEDTTYYSSVEDTKEKLDANVEFKAAINQDDLYTLEGGKYQRVQAGSAFDSGKTYFTLEDSGVKDADGKAIFTATKVNPADIKTVPQFVVKNDDKVCDENGNKLAAGTVLDPKKTYYVNYSNPVDPETYQKGTEAENLSEYMVNFEGFFDKDGNRIADNGLYRYFDDAGEYKGGLYAKDAAGELVEAQADEVVENTVAGKADTGVLTLSLHVGADATRNNQISVGIEAMSASSLGIKAIKVDGADDTNALSAIDTIKEAIQKVSTQRSALGAVQNRLEHTINNLDNIVENTTSAESQIRDTDMATEMVKYSNNNILAQAGQAMLAQANQANQGVLSLLG